MLTRTLSTTKTPETTTLNAPSLGGLTLVRTKGFIWCRKCGTACDKYTITCKNCDTALSDRPYIWKVL